MFLQIFTELNFVKYLLNLKTQFVIYHVLCWTLVAVMQQVISHLIKCAVAFVCAGQEKLMFRTREADVPDKRRWCTVDLCSARPCVESHRVESCTPPPPKPRSPPTQATLGSVYQQPYRGMDLDGAHQEDLHTAKNPWSMDAAWREPTLSFYFHISIISLWNTPQISCLLSMIVVIFWVINHKSRIKASACVNHISSSVSWTCLLYWKPWNMAL